MSLTIRITKRFTFEAAHALNKHDGDCKYVHGHSYKLYITVIGSPINDNNNPKNGMVIDFKELKSIVKEHIINKYDHAIILNNQDQKDFIDSLALKNMKIVISKNQTTCENMLYNFASILNPLLKEKNIKLFSIKLYETESSYAEWFANDQL